MGVGAHSPKTPTSIAAARVSPPILDLAVGLIATLGVRTGTGDVWKGGGSPRFPRRHSRRARLPAEPAHSCCGAGRRRRSPASQEPLHRTSACRRCDKASQVSGRRVWLRFAARVSVRVSALDWFVVIVDARWFVRDESGIIIGHRFACREEDVIAQRRKRLRSALCVALVDAPANFADGIALGRLNTSHFARRGTSPLSLLEPCGFVRLAVRAQRRRNRGKRFEERHVTFGTICAAATGERQHR